MTDMSLKSKFLALFVIFLGGCASYKPYVPTESTLPPPRVIENVNVALALGGGGSKGVVHLGVLEVFEEYGIPIDLIVGTSAGSIVGSLYADNADAKVTKDMLLNMNKDDFLDVYILDSIYFFSDLVGPVRGRYLEKFVAENYAARKLEDLKIPFVAVATDVANDKSITLDSGPISTAIHASSAIPPLFTPVNAYGMLLVDGGVVEPVPVLTAKRYDPKIIIAVDISTPGRGYDMYNMFDVTYRSMYISYYVLSRMQSALADVTIHPDLAGFGMFSDSQNYILYQKGRDEALKMMPTILKELKKRKIPLKKKTYKLMKSLS